MSAVVVLMLASSLLTVLLTCVVAMGHTSAATDRYILMRLTLMRIANGVYSNPQAKASEVMEIVSNIDDARVSDWRNENAQ